MSYDFDRDLVENDIKKRDVESSKSFIKTPLPKMSSLSKKRMAQEDNPYYGPENGVVNRNRFANFKELDLNEIQGCERAKRTRFILLSTALALFSAHVSIALMNSTEIVQVSSSAKMVEKEKIAASDSEVVPTVTQEQELRKSVNAVADDVAKKIYDDTNIIR